MEFRELNPGWQHSRQIDILLIGLSLWSLNFNIVVFIFLGDVGLGLWDQINSIAGMALACMWPT